MLMRITYHKRFIRPITFVECFPRFHMVYTLKHETSCGIADRLFYANKKSALYSFLYTSFALRFSSSSLIRLCLVLYRTLIQFGTPRHILSACQLLCTCFRHPARLVQSQNGTTCQKSRLQLVLAWQLLIWISLTPSSCSKELGTRACHRLTISYPISEENR